MLQFELHKRLRDGDRERTLHLALSAAPGEVIALSGPSGVGKTTVLRMLAGLEPASTGQIRFGDGVWFDAARGYSLPTAQRRIGFMFQDYALFPHLRVREQLEYARRDAPREQVDRWLTLMQLEALADRKPGQLSGGQRQRLALARAMVGQPQLLLLDEPLSALDSALRHEIQRHLQQALAAQPTTTLLVSHDAGEILRLAQRVVQLSATEPARIGNPRDLLLGPLRPGRCLLHAELLLLIPGDVMATAVLSVGSDRITTLIPLAEAQQLQPGQAVRVELNGTSAVIRP